ncbi:MAG: serpin family protein [Armatimonadetes bacterium]|nr:serpin family protein [Armatimonadota bacterium]
MKFAFFLGVSGLIFIAGCGGAGDTSTSATTMRPASPEEVKAAEASVKVDKNFPKVTAGLNTLGLKTLGSLIKDQGQNRLISPTSISLALGMAYTGAGGTTKKEMETAMGLNKILDADYQAAVKTLMTLTRDADSGVVLNIANGLWTQTGFEIDSKYSKTTQDAFLADTKTLDFKQQDDAGKAINDWVSEKTAGKIPSLVDKLPTDTKVVLTNAVYFHGMWTTPFKKEMTRPADFTKSDGKVKSVDMMQLSGMIAGGESKDAQWIVLPYGKGRAQMTVVLPAKGVKWEDFLKGLTAQQLTKWNATATKHDSLVRVPSFKFDSTLDLKAIMPALGLKETLSDKADFSGISVKQRLIIDQFIHKTYIDVNEEGTEAAAATGITMMPTAVRVQEFTFTADRPFLYFITEATSGALLFAGYEAAPPASQPKETGETNGGK